MADPSTASDVTDTLTKAGASGGIVAAMGVVMAWVRGERARERAEDERAKRHAEIVEAFKAHTEAMVAAMAEQSRAQLAGIQAASEAQAKAFAEAGVQRFEALSARLEALASTFSELKADLRELRVELRGRP